PHNLNRVNVLALSLERPGASPRLVTAGDTRLPFIAYARALYLPSGLLALSAGNALWVVNSQSGKTASIANRDAPVWTGAGDTLLVRDTANAASSWQLLNAATLNGL
ncbi:MAG: hypothetical protein JOY77_01915, partial [Alphaproteobacteria bacterium]|nr:hypothetical protein [Alphaproteobacteria bacterium]